MTHVSKNIYSSLEQGESHVSIGQSRSEKKKKTSWLFLVVDIVDQSNITRCYLWKLPSFIAINLFAALITWQDITTIFILLKKDITIFIVYYTIIILVLCTVYVDFFVKSHYATYPKG